MPLSHIEHFLVAADDIDATRDWYARVLGMRSGPHPEFGFPVHWMYLGDTDVVHIGPSAKSADENQKRYLGRTSGKKGQEDGTGAIDHIAFRATGLRTMIDHLQKERITFSRRRASGLREMMEHLRKEQVAFNQRRANGQALYQLFFHDPNGIKIELNFAAQEAEGIAPELMASDFAKA